MSKEPDILLGVGLYGLAEAARLTGISSARIKRWVAGYTYARNGKTRAQPSLWKADLDPIEGQVALSFRDLMEVRFVDAFHQRGVSMQALRLAAKRAADYIEHPHPFSSYRFLTDGRSVFVEAQERTGDPHLLDLCRNQYAFESVLRPYLKGLDRDDDGTPIRWWPMGQRTPVVLDPSKHFGQPIVAESNVPTSLLATAAAREGIDAAAVWFDVGKREVMAAVEFEKKLVAVGQSARKSAA